MTRGNSQKLSSFGDPWEQSKQPPGPFRTVKTASTALPNRQNCARDGSEPRRSFRSNRQNCLRDPSDRTLPDRPNSLHGPSEPRKQRPGPFRTGKTASGTLSNRQNFFRDPSEPPKLPRGPFGTAGSSVIFSLIFKDLNGFIMYFHGFSWISMDFNGFSWISMDFNGVGLRQGSRWGVKFGMGFEISR